MAFQPAPAVVLCAFTFACCATPGDVGHEISHVPGIRIITGEQARAWRLRGRHFELRFGDNQDGTKLVLDYLDRAKRVGGRYVSDIAIVLTTVRDGVAVACTSRLTPFAKQHSYPVKQETAGRVEYHSVLKPVTETVTEYQYQCRMVTRPVTRMETSYQSQYDYVSKSSRMVPVTRTVMSYEMQSECSSVPVTRTVTRYQHQLEAKYVPPQLSYIAAHFTDFDLIEELPACRPEPSGPREAQLPHRITGTVYGAAQR